MRRQQCCIVLTLLFATPSFAGEIADTNGILYQTQLTAAEALYRLDQIGEARHMLEETEPPSRGWEWRLLHARTDRSVRTLRGHAQPVSGLAAGPDGRLLASGSADMTIVLWDATTGEQLRTLTGHTGQVTSLDFSPDGSRLVSGSTDKSVRVWDVNTGALKHTFTSEFSRGIYQARYSRDGRMIGVASWERSTEASQSVLGFAKVLEAESGRLVGRFDTDNHPAASVAFSPDDRKIITGTWGFHVKQHDIASGVTDWDHDLSPLEYYTAIQSVDAGSDGRFIVQGGKDNRIRLLKAGNGTLVYQIDPWHGHREWVNAVRFSPDNRLFASGSDDGLVMVWETATGKRRHIFRGHAGGITRVAWHPDGTTLFSASADATVKVWTLELPGELQFKTCSTGPWYAPVSPDGNLVAIAGSDRAFTLWNLNTGTQDRFLDSLSATSAVFSADGKLVAAGAANTLYCFDVATGEMRFTAPGHTGTIYGLAFCSQQLLFASAGDRTVRLWNAADGSPARVIETGSPAYTVQFTPDQRRLVVGCRDGTVRFYSTATWELQDSIRSGTTILNLAVSADGTYMVTGGDNGECTAWDIRDMRPLGELRGHTKWIYGIAFHPSLPYAITVSYDRTARIWDLRRRVCTLTLRGFTEPLYTASIVRNGDRLVLTQVDGTVLVLETGRD